MKPAFEAPRFERSGASLVAFERKEQRFDWNWHYHPEIELTWIRRGNGRRLVGDHAADYGADDLVLVGSNLPHTWFSAPKVLRNQAVVVQFHPQMFPEPLLHLPEFVSIRQILVRANCGLRFKESDARRAGPDLLALVRERGLAAWLRLAKILHQLAAKGSPLPLASAAYHHGRSYRLNSRLERVTAYIEKNSGEKLPLTQAARMAGLTPSAFSRFFRKMTHQTYVSYRNACRIREASRLLIESDRSITQAAYECGFGNLANFNRRFRDVHRMSPGQYRRLHIRAD